MQPAYTLASYEKSRMCVLYVRLDDDDIEKYIKM